MRNHQDALLREDSPAYRISRDNVSAKIRQLRDQLHKDNPQLNKPTGAMIDHLISNCPDHLFEDSDQQTALHQALCFIEFEMSPARELSTEILFRRNSGAPLFPNEELFDQQDAFMFAKGLLHLLRKPSKP